MKMPEAISKIKYNRLKIGAILFILAMGCSITSIIWMGSQMPIQDEQDHVDIIGFVSEQKNAVAQNMSLCFEGSVKKSKGIPRIKPQSIS